MSEHTVKIDMIEYPIPEEVANLIHAISLERDLAVAHDTQPYPTAHAYEMVCNANEEKRVKLEKAEAENARMRDENKQLGLLVYDPESDLTGCLTKPSAVKSARQSPSGEKKASARVNDIMKGKE